MPLHSFAVGQRVEFAPSRSDGDAPPGIYTVVRLLPNDSNDREYRVKSTRDGHERVVRESQIRREPVTQNSKDRAVFARMTGVPKP
ncbi:MAG: hypothetical protein BroJett030_26100 [Alphaproteobacteria bacterium]|nr:MAG: hypothetical protein BroJett030_26100 [Alphaproteobacteria bacterium]